MVFVGTALWFFECSTEKLEWSHSENKEECLFMSEWSEGKMTQPPKDVFLQYVRFF